MGQMNRIEDDSKRRLLARRAALSRAIGAAACDAQQPSGENPGGGVPVGPGRLSRSEQNELYEIEAAIRRIEQGTYGRCEACGGAIGRQRLLALPQVRHCMDCAADGDARQLG